MRKTNTIKYITASIISNVLNVIVNYISRKIFIQYIGFEYLGLSGLLTSMLSMLSLLELGVGSAIFFSLYKPLADEDKEEIKAIMRLYGTLYKYIGLAVLVVGILLLPLLPYLIKNDYGMESVRLIYMLFLIDSVLSYFLAYRGNIINADQKGFIIININTIFNLLVFATQVWVAIMTQNYIAYLLIKLLYSLIKNIIIYFKSNQLYGYLKDTNVKPLSPTIKRTIIQNTKALFVINLSTYLVFGTDNILLSVFTNLTSVGIYSNYNLIINSVNSFTNIVITGAKASLGNYLVTESKEKQYQLFKNMFFLNFIIISYTSVSLIILTNDFISIWLGGKYVWPLAMLCILVFNNYSRHILGTIGVYINAAGLYNPFSLYKYFSLIEGLINLFVSILLAKYFSLGVYGIFIGTSISTVVSTVAMPLVVYKYIFAKKLSSFYKVYFKYLVLTLVYGVIGVSSYHLLASTNLYFNLVSGFLIGLIVPTGCTYFLFKGTQEFQYFHSMVSGFLTRMKEKILK